MDHNVLEDVEENNVVVSSAATPVEHPTQPQQQQQQQLIQGQQQQLQLLQQNPPLLQQPHLQQQLQLLQQQPQQTQLQQQLVQQQQLRLSQQHLQLLQQQSQQQHHVQLQLLQQQSRQQELLQQQLELLRQLQPQLQLQQQPHQQQQLELVQQAQPQQQPNLQQQHPLLQPQALPQPHPQPQERQQQLLPQEQPQLQDPLLQQPHQHQHKQLQPDLQPQQQHPWLHPQSHPQPQGQQPQLHQQPEQQPFITDLPTNQQLMDALNRGALHILTEPSASCPVQFQAQLQLPIQQWGQQPSEAPSSSGDNSNREAKDDAILELPVFGSPLVVIDQLEDKERQCNHDRVYVSLMREDPNINMDILPNDEDDELGSDDGDEGSSAMSNDRTLAEALHVLQLQINSDETSFINVRRGAIWLDTCRQLLRKRFSPRNRVSVEFADSEGKSEGAVGVGGPKREFFRMLVKAAKEESGIFIGPERCKSLFPNSNAREQDRYRIVGLVLAWSLVHGGPVGNFLSPALYNSIAYGPGVIPPRLEDVPVQQLKQKIQQIVESATLAQLQECLDGQEIKQIVEGQGASTFPLSLEEKEWYVKIILRHLLVDSTAYLLEDFKRGLQTLGVLEAITNHPERFRDVFTKENLKPLDFATVNALFSIELAEVGSNERAKQELAIVNWRDYLQDCESGDAKASLSDVLAFVTGAERPPILGFDTIPTIGFHGETFPTANTCGIILRLPIIHEEYEEFKSIMDFAILNSPCFGQT